MLGIDNVEPISLECSRCKIKTTKGITTDRVYSEHGSHLDSVVITVMYKGERCFFVPELPVHTA